MALNIADLDLRGVSDALARRTFRCKAWAMGAALDWARPYAEKAGFAGVTVACEPTGPRWLQVQRLCAERGLPLVCWQCPGTGWQSQRGLRHPQRPG